MRAYNFFLDDESKKKVEEIKEKIEFLVTHNKNYNKSQWFAILEVKDLFDEIFKELENKEAKAMMNAIFQDDMGTILYEQVTSLFYKGNYWLVDFADGTGTKVYDRLIQVFPSDEMEEY